MNRHPYERVTSKTSYAATRSLNVSRPVPGQKPKALKCTTIAAATSRSKEQPHSQRCIRVGHAFGSLLLYGTGGVAWARTQTDMQTISITGPVTMSELSSQTYHVGWTVGGGAEWAITPNLSLKAEYLYVDLGSANYDPKGLAYAGQPGEFKHHELMSGDIAMHIARMGLNYKF